MAKVKKSDSYTSYAKYGKKMQMGGKTPMTPKQKQFAALAAPKDKITFADRIAGAKKGAAKMKKGGTVSMQLGSYGRQPGKNYTGKAKGGARMAKKAMKNCRGGC